MIAKLEAVSWHTSAFILSDYLRPLSNQKIYAIFSIVEGSSNPPLK